MEHLTNNHLCLHISRKTVFGQQAHVRGQYARVIMFCQANSVTGHENICFYQESRIFGGFVLCV